ncbi:MULTISPECIES: aldo/keto reductase [unclassified Devosia]|uniref:aldo/keto reductase n=1 Tax=unclassified Devosia TaxID=196773 RepID=UPI00086ECAB3|nr:MULTISPECIES: aldo/keto reductase [unclassified Devosia]MBN9363217.1 aldo/keto reductase [Devosia sp.]ODS82956.1 MAG: aldo/keto reductase [Devosia sp. SCN 66-27]OJX25064.1 MAG: aldo/keto reductase [Devosia sp. 66-14]
MKMKTLGRTDISVSEICLGTMTWGKQNTEAEGHQQMDYAVAQGVNFFDTAEMYAVPPDASTYGKTEEIIGTWFKNTGRRNDIVLASKVAGGGRPWVRGGRGIDGPSVREAVEGSLRRLQTDRIDLYQIHWPRRGHYHFEGSWDYNPYLQDKQSVLPNMLEVLQVMGELVREGKILHFGLSNESAWGTMQYLKLSMELGLPRVQTIQNEYNFLRRYYDMDLAELAFHEDVGLLAYSPLAAGAISGKYLGGALPEGTRGAVAGSAYRNNQYTEPAIRAYMALADKHGLDVCQMAIAFCLTKPFMTSVIIGATTMEQLKTNIAAADIQLSQVVLDEIQQIFMRYARTL